MALSLRPRIRLRDLAKKLIRRSSSAAAAGKFPSPAGGSRRRAVLPLPSEMVPCSALTPHHIASWNLWQTDRLSIKQIGERLKAEEETVVNHLTLCIKSGCSIDWVDVCREAGLFPGVAKLVEETYGRHHGLSTVSSSSVVSSLKVTGEQHGVYRVMRACGIDHEGIAVISSAAAQAQEWSTLSAGEDRCRDVKSSAANGGANKQQRVLPRSSSSDHVEMQVWEQLPLAEAVEALELVVEEGKCGGSSFPLVEVLLRRCSAQKELDLGGRVYAVAVQCGCESNPIVGNQMIRLYASHGRLDEASEVLSSVAAPDCHMWASIISAHGEQGHPSEAIHLYRRMRQHPRGVKANSYVYVATLKACSKAQDLAAGREVHADILAGRSWSSEADAFVGSALVDMYAKCGSLEDARAVFERLPAASRDVVTWTAMMAGYAQAGRGGDALALYDAMETAAAAAAAAAVPNRVTFVCLLQACGGAKDLRRGRRLHAQIRRRGWQADAVLGNCLVDMYAKCGDLGAARAVFDDMPRRDVVSWTSMMAGYCQHGQAQDALALYAAMQQEVAEGGFGGNSVTLVCLVQACGSAGAVQQGRRLHALATARGLDADDPVVGNALVDMYGKCGDVGAARATLDRMRARDVVAWTALLHGYAHAGEGALAVRAFEEMRADGVRPDAAAFLCLLAACSRAGMVAQGRRYFRSMAAEHGVAPTQAHHHCVVDMLARAGHLDDAERMLLDLDDDEDHPADPDPAGWTSLLAACRADLARAERCFARAVAMDPHHSAPYVLLQHLYARLHHDSGGADHPDVARIELLRRAAGAWKKPAKACVEVRGRVLEFVVGGAGARADVASRARAAAERARRGGHVPRTELVVGAPGAPGAPAASQADKERALCGHAEKLALAYALLNTPDGAPVLVTKNLRMCDDCHSGTKVVSRVERREIVVRDAHRVHRFVDGSCSCGDRP